MGCTSLARTDFSKGSVERQASRLGVMPSERRTCTLCWVGLVFCSPTTPSTGTRLTWMTQKLSTPTRNWNCLRACGHHGPSPWDRRHPLGCPATSSAGDFKAKLCSPEFIGRCRDFEASARRQTARSGDRHLDEGHGFNVSHGAPQLNHAHIGWPCKAVHSHVRHLLDPILHNPAMPVEKRCRSHHTHQ